MKKLRFLSLLAIAFPLLGNAQEIEKYQVLAEKLDKSRSNLSPQIGSSTYSFSLQDIENLRNWREFGAIWVETFLLFDFG